MRGKLLNNFLQLKEYLKKKTFSDNLLTLKSSKISMSFFLQSKRN